MTPDLTKETATTLSLITLGADRRISQLLGAGRRWLLEVQCRVSYFAAYLLSMERGPYAKHYFHPLGTYKRRGAVESYAIGSLSPDLAVLIVGT